MEHSGLHPEFGLFSPTPRLRRELRIAAISLLCGGIAGALCVSGVVALRHSDNAAMEIAEGSACRGAQESESGTGPSADARAASPESHAGTAAPPQASAEVPAQRSSETSAPAVAPAITPKARVVRIRKAVDSPSIARLPLGRSEAPAAVSPPPADPPLSRQAADAVPAGNDVAAAAPEKAVARSAASEGVANLSPPKKKQKTVRAAALGAMTSRTIPSGARSGRTIGARAPPPSMTDAARPVVHMRARVLCRSEAFGTGRDNILAGSQGAIAVLRI